uniref:ATPase AAA-type core domain-containing protein n=1 Tax=mine drainage metagenome TaxID=410659 RepID=E6PG81_9ZZZZ
MVRVRKVEIRNFRGIRELAWLPKPGINCLIGHGDSGKSTILDAIDICLGARRTIQISDADFHQLDTDSPITITLTLGDLDDSLKAMDAYGLYLRSFSAATGEFEDEPKRDTETVLTLQFSVGNDLEPVWTLISERASTQNATRNLAWADRARLAPTRIGAVGENNLSWRRGSVLNFLSDESPDVSAALLKAARDARSSFGESAEEQLRDVLELVSKTATELGVPVGERAKALLDAHSVSFTGGTISLHDEDGIPLRGLGAGSSRLLVAGLQRAAAKMASIILIDELEIGLEPHRIVRLLGSLGAKESPCPLQAFVTTHSPTVLRELKGSQLLIVRDTTQRHQVIEAGDDDDVQSTIRRFPEAFLAPSVIVCEGASEVGFLRGIDYHRTARGETGIGAIGVALVDAGGGDVVHYRANAFRRLGYRTAILRDDDKKPSEELERSFKEAGGAVICWRDSRALEDELFLSVPTACVSKLIDRAAEIHGGELINEHIKTSSGNRTDLNKLRDELLRGALSDESRVVLGKASRFRNTGWFKSVTWMEEAARDIVGPDLEKSDPAFQDIVRSVFEWSVGGPV